MNTNRLFLKELKGLAENGLPLNEYAVEQLQQRFDKSPYIITQLYQLLTDNRYMLLPVEDIEATVYDYIIHQEMTHGKTLYGAVTAVAELFHIPQTYVRFKLNQYRQSVS